MPLSYLFCCCSGICSCCNSLSCLVHFLIFDLFHIPLGPNASRWTLHSKRKGSKGGIRGFICWIKSVSSNLIGMVMASSWWKGKLVHRKRKFSSVLQVTLITFEWVLTFVKLIVKEKMLFSLMTSCSDRILVQFSFHLKLKILLWNWNSIKRISMSFM